MFVVYSISLMCALLVCSVHYQSEVCIIGFSVHCHVWVTKDLYIFLTLLKPDH